MKIAILLPDAAEYDTFWRAAKLARMLSSLSSPAGNPVEVTIGLPKVRDALWRRRETDIRHVAPAAVVRYIGWERVETAMAMRMYAHVQTDLHGIDEVRLPRDFGWNFIDCDAWIAFADPAMGAILPVKPMAYYVRDLAARYAPDAFATDIRDAYWRRQTDSFRLWRQARAVFAADDATLLDLASYAGLRRDRLLKVPPLTPDGPDGEPVVSARPSPSLLWLAEPDARHDIANALAGLRMFYAEGGKARLVIAGAQHFGEAATTLALVAADSRLGRVLDTADFEILQTGSDLRRLLRRVDLVWSSAIADGENEGLLRAAAASVPFAGRKYPQNVALAGISGVNATLYDLSDAASIADALHSACAEIRGGIRPTPETAPEPLPEAWLPVLDRLAGGIA